MGLLRVPIFGVFEAGVAFVVDIRLLWVWELLEG